MNNRITLTLLLSAGAWLSTLPSRGAEVLVEAEAFTEHGGWVVDPQFMDIMGSPYLLAHGLGKPVANAKTEAEFPAPGAYRLWVRTLDWVPSHHPGRFKVVVAGTESAATFGEQGDGWVWQDGGIVEIKEKTAAIELKDLTGFDGRCDALFFTTDRNFTPPATPDAAMAAWRRKLLRLPEAPLAAGTFDVVVVGGGIPGCAAALAAARLGLSVALIQDRPVLGGNGSDEIGLTHYWEYGQYLDPIKDAERVRDHLLCAIYGTFATAKRRDPEKNANLELAWVGHIAATGEALRLIGDHILTENDIRSQAPFPDAVATCSGHFCLHYPGAKYDFRLGDWKWIPVKPYSVPFRCLYSRNIENLMMACKCVSVSHVAGSSTKTMLNGGQFGVATAAAAFLCKKHNTTPRGIYQQHLAELQDIVFERGEHKDALKPR